MAEVNKKTSPPTSIDSPQNKGVDCQKEYEKDFLRLMGLVRDIRAEAQNLLNFLANIKKKGEFIDADVRKKELESVFEESKKIYNHNHKQIEERIKSIRVLMDAIPCLYDLAGDEITIIENLLERISLKWDELLVNGKTIENEQLSKNISEINKFLGEIIYHACVLTIPVRVNQHLDHLRTGQTLDFHEIFEDELPLKKYRDKILFDLYSHPKEIHGAVDLKSGLIYNASKDRWRQYQSYFWMIAILIAGGLSIYFSPDIGIWLNLENWPVTPEKKIAYLTGYLFIIFGGFVHIGLGMLKQSRSGNEQTFMALSDMLLWIHIKELSIIAGIISLIFGFWGSALILQKIDWQTAFFVGYSIDSFIDIFLLRFTGTISSQTELLKGSLKTQKDDT